MIDWLIDWLIARWRVCDNLFFHPLLSPASSPHRSCSWRCLAFVTIFFLLLLYPTFSFPLCHITVILEVDIHVCPLCPVRLRFCCCTQSACIIFHISASERAIFLAVHCTIRFFKSISIQLTMSLFAEPYGGVTSKLLAFFMHHQL